MNHFYLSFVILIFLINNLSAQPCMLNSITFNHQSQINSFATNYPNCTEIPGNLTIEEDFPFAEILSLSGLSQLTTIGGNLNIASNRDLTSLEGLENLTTIGGYLRISGNYNLLSLEELANLDSIGGDLNIRYSDALTSLTGLENITSVGGGLEIWWNDALVSLKGLENITSVGGEMNIRYNPLPGLTDLQNIISVGEDLTIWGNNDLTTLIGLENITSIGGALNIRYSEGLTNLMGIENINVSGITYLNIDYNPNLSICELPNICTYLNNGGDYRISDNAPNCNSIEEILALCPVVSSTTPDNLPQVIISPNPTNGTFTLQNIPTGIYQILNTSGQIIRQGEMKNNLLIDISHQTNGVYFISVAMDNDTLVRRIVKI